MSMKLASQAGTDHRALLEPELHIVGELTGGSGFDADNAFCKFDARVGPTWLCVGGDEQGQTQVDYVLDGNGLFVWSHPIDLHYYTKSLQGWPKIMFEVWHLDAYGVQELTGYGFTCVPTQPGAHELECTVWRPVGTDKEEVFSYFLGSVPQLLDKEIVDNPTKAKSERNRIYSKMEGKVHLHLEVVLRNVDAHEIQHR
jgi:B9 domain-containing protein 2